MRADSMELTLARVVVTEALPVKALMFMATAPMMRAMMSRTSIISIRVNPWEWRVLMGRIFMMEL